MAHPCGGVQVMAHVHEVVCGPSATGPPDMPTRFMSSRRPCRGVLSRDPLTPRTIAVIVKLRLAGPITISLQDVPSSRIGRLLVCEALAFGRAARMGTVPVLFAGRV